MKTKIFFILGIFSLLLITIFYSSANSFRSIPDTVINKRDNLDQRPLSPPQLSQEIAWDDNGIVICNEDTQKQECPQICSDGAGGAIITWQDERNGANFDIYAQKVDSAGNTLWEANGIIICNEDTEHQYGQQICSDGSGGAIITWQDNRTGANLDIYAQRIKGFSRSPGLALSSADDDDDDDDNNGAMILVVAIIVLACVCAGILIFILFRKKRISKAPKSR
ncbi:MAG: hypothetical protein EU548_03460 [Promethearchaeota archaeon]|nr:MAG: hypothetical protein EU548_03460 [Candidatus Lokiarchaeota archaeon]